MWPGKGCAWRICLGRGRTFAFGVAAIFAKTDLFGVGGFAFRILGCHQRKILWKAKHRAIFILGQAVFCLEVAFKHRKSAAAAKAVHLVVGDGFFDRNRGGGDRRGLRDLCRCGKRNWHTGKHRHEPLSQGQDVILTGINDFMFQVLASAFDVLHEIEPIDMPEMPTLTRAANREPILNTAYLAAKRRHQFYVLDSETPVMQQAYHG